MLSRTRLALLLLTTAMTTPGIALAQDAPPTSADSGAEGVPATDSAPGDAAASPQAAPAEQPVEEAAPEEAAPEVSLPGEIIVTGNRNRNVARASDQVVSVLGTAEIARTGEGNIAGALGRVTGLSVVGSGFVYVRGLGDRYSLALLNGLPLPSPEPLRRVVPLDIFPTNVIASSLVQKSYSANFPGEFGGGVINLTTTAVPRESFLTISGGIGGDSETTGQFGYSYYGSKTDFTGFDNGSRDAPSALAAFFASGERIGDGTVDTGAIASELVRPRFALLQKVRNLAPNFSGSVTGGTSFEIGGDMTLGFIATAGISNKWLNRDIRQQTPSTADLSQTETDFRRVVTDNRVVVNALLGAGLEFGLNKIRWTNLFIRDTIKEGRLARGSETTTGFTRLNQDTAWFERQLLDTQLVGEFRFGSLGLDLRGGYANTQREAPYELSFEYVRSNRATDPFGDQFINRLNNGQNGGASVAFSDLNEDLWFGGIDVSYLVVPRLTATAGYSYTDTQRDSERREFQFIAPSTFPSAVGLFRPDFLLQPSVIDFYDIELVETTESDPAFAAGLRVHGGYGKINYEPIDGLTIDAGVRYERGRQTVAPIEVFNTPSNSLASTALNESYWLPSATVTWEVAPRMQLRANASKTIARPQFRELIFQQYYDPESNRQFRGNPLLTDSELINAEARFEWHFASEQRLSFAAFYKSIDRPIEAFTGFSDNQPQTSYANAPKANLYGGEFELQKHFDVSSLGGWFGTRRAVAIANYTYTKSKIMVGADDIVAVFGTTPQPAVNFFRGGAPLTGQSDHIANLQLGFEDTDRLSQQTLLLSYASERVTSRGPVGLPDIVERPGLRIDFVAREAMDFLGQEIELKFEARNLTARRHEEFQQSGSNRIEINTFDVGRSFSLSASAKF